MTLTLSIEDRPWKSLTFESDGKNIRYEEVTLTPVDTLALNIHLPQRIEGLSLFDRIRVLFGHPINIEGITIYDH